MAGLWAISLGIDPRFPTFSLNFVQGLSAAARAYSVLAGVSGPCARPLGWTLDGFSLLVDCRVDS